MKIYRGWSFLDRDGEFADGGLTMMNYHGQLVTAQHTNGKAIAALACGIGGFFVFPASIAAVVLGHVARREVALTGETGSGLATAGLILGYIGLAIGILLVLAFILLVLLLGSWS